MLHLEEDLEVDGVDDDECHDIRSPIPEDEEKSLAVVRPLRLSFVEDV